MPHPGQRFRPFIVLDEERALNIAKTDLPDNAAVTLAALQKNESCDDNKFPKSHA